MKRSTNNSFNQISAPQKIAVAFCIPLITTLMVAMFAFTGFKKIQEEHHLIRENLVQAGETLNREEVFRMIEISEAKIKRFQVLLLTITMMSIVVTIVLAFFLARTISVTTGGGDGLPPEARGELAAMRRKIEEMLNRY